MSICAVATGAGFAIPGGALIGYYLHQLMVLRDEKNNLSSSGDTICAAQLLTGIDKRIEMAIVGACIGAGCFTVGLVIWGIACMRNRCATYCCNFRNTSKPHRVVLRKLREEDVRKSLRNTRI